MKKLLVISSILFASCKVLFVPSANQVIHQQVISTAQKTDDFYQVMQASNDKRYSTYALKYAELQGDIIAIERADSLRPNASMLLSQVKQLRTFFTACMNNHFARNTLNNTQFELYRQQLAGYWKPILINEEHYK